MPTITETLPHDGGFMVSQASGDRSRDAITVAAGQTLGAGAVLGRVTANGHYAVYNPAAMDGSQTAVGVLWGAVDASAAAAPGVGVLRDAEVRRASLQWFAGATDPQQETGVAELAAVGIIAR